VAYDPNAIEYSLKMKQEAAGDKLEDEALENETRMRFELETYAMAGRRDC
jgi:hypothetical protein